MRRPAPLRRVVADLRRFLMAVERSPWCRHRGSTARPAIAACSTRTGSGRMNSHRPAGRLPQGALLRPVPRRPSRPGPQPAECSSAGAAGQPTKCRSFRRRACRCPRRPSGTAPVPALPDRPNLNWERIGARYRLAIGEGAGEDELFLPFGAPAQEEARISAEELKAALEDDDDRRPVLLDLCLPMDLPRRTDMLAGASMHAPAALGRGAAAKSADRGLLHLRISGQWQGRDRAATAGL
jgi:hypothetical protein